MTRAPSKARRSSAATLLVEVGTEELPPRAIARLGEAFATALVKRLSTHALVADVAPVWYATPRRLAVTIPAVLRRQPDRISERRGPALSKAFDAAGSPTAAATGFAGSCGVSVDQLVQNETDKGAWLVYRTSQPGALARDLIPESIESALTSLPVSKKMRWGAGTAEFVRPVHWLVVLHGQQTIRCSIFGVPSSNTSHGHRFMCKTPVRLTSADSYSESLKNSGHVIADFSARRSTIEAQIKRLGQRAGGVPVVDAALLEIVTGLVEEPHALLGSFEPAFLQMPAEILVCAMRDHQKYFHLVDEKGQLLPKFIAVSNIRSKQPARVRQGNERVLQARLSDARFFWDEDRKRTLESRVADLESVTFHHELGSLRDKTDRLIELAGHLARLLDEDADNCQRAAQLCKADLVTDMVGEFPDLQGVMGRYYAIHGREKKAIGRAIEEHYHPRHAGDALPQSKAGRILAVADRIDSLIGLFAVGEFPSGDSDPYALRRAALGIIRILVEKKVDLDIAHLVDLSAAAYEQAGLVIDTQIRQQVKDFIVERYRALYLAAGFSNDEISAVIQSGATRPLDFDRRLKAVAKFRRAPAAANLAAANKRIRNILRKVDQQVPLKINDQLFEHQAEHDLSAALVHVSTEVSPLIERTDYAGALQLLSALSAPVDRFFDNVMVMAEDPALRNNRLALLNQLATLFLAIADISVLQMSD